MELTEANKEKCIYFSKTGVCKYGNMCNKSHFGIQINKSMTTLIFPGMYTNMLLGYELLRLGIDTGIIIRNNLKGLV